jgi:hypothetical protein
VVGEVDGGRSGGAPRGEGNDVPPPSAHRIGEVAAKTAFPQRIGYELVLQNTEAGASGFEVEDLSDHRVDQALNVSPQDPVAVAVTRNETSPFAVFVSFEDDRSRTCIHDGVRTASEEQAFELPRRRPEGRCSLEFGQIREGDHEDDRKYCQQEDCLD